MTVHDFWYDLPERLIAQEPSEVRDGCRLLVADRKSGELSHHIFREIIDYLNPGDVLVINDSKVIPARMIGQKSDSGIDMEVLLLRQIELDTWEALTRPGRRAKIGTTIVFGDGLLRAEVVDVV
ncbi:MAG: S-adenosylmethionine:tRNA ribosyltransferase-isomerase, partial [Clostridia bacterium]|nr:S-adenosylmethionine:tRNA ribosyltransferase-isomerase [Clostridia bacterium]